MCKKTTLRERLFRVCGIRSNRWNASSSLASQGSVTDQADVSADFVNQKKDRPYLYPDGNSNNNDNNNGENNNGVIFADDTENELGDNLAVESAVDGDLKAKAGSTAGENPGIDLASSASAKTVSQRTLAQASHRQRAAELFGLRGGYTSLATYAEDGVGVGSLGGPNGAPREVIVTIEVLSVLQVNPTLTPSPTLTLTPSPSLSLTLQVRIVRTIPNHFRRIPLLNSSLLISYHIISYHIISYHIISYHIISNPFLILILGPLITSPPIFSPTTSVYMTFTSTLTLTVSLTPLLNPR